MSPIANWKRMVTVAALTGCALLLVACKEKDTVVKGSDLLRTADETSFDFPSIGPVSLQGNPLNPAATGLADTIVQRQADAVVTPGDQTGATIPIEMVGLSLQSKKPVPFPGKGDCNIYVTLDKLGSKHSTGHMTIVEDQAGGKGTFTSKFDHVYFTVSATDTVTHNPCMPEQALDLDLAGARPTEWQKDPHGAFTVQGPLGDQDANLHSGLTGRMEDFFIKDVVEDPAPIPRTQERVQEKHLKVIHTAGSAPAQSDKTAN